jgi:hypothetical protein
MKPLKLEEKRMPESSGDFINVAKLAKALAEELKPALDTNTPLKRVFNMEEAAIYCGMPLTSFKAKVVRDRIRKVRVDRCCRFDRADLDAWIDRHLEEIRAEEDAA